MQSKKLKAHPSNLIANKSQPQIPRRRKKWKRKRKKETHNKEEEEEESGRNKGKGFLFEELKWGMDDGYYTTYSHRSKRESHLEIENVEDQNNHVQKKKNTN